MRTAGKLIMGHAGRRAVGLAALVVVLGGATYADASPRPALRDAGGSNASLSYAQAPEWIAAHQGGYGNDPSSPGPSVTVNVPTSGGRMGFIEVWAQVKANSNQTAVGLFDVTGGHRRFVPGQDTLCSTTAGVPLPGDLFMTLDGVPGVYGTPMSVAACAGALGPPGPVLLRVPAGQRRFRLEYADCGCGGPGKAAVSHRWLWIRPAPTS
jgi:hypothetical protein